MKKATAIITLCVVAAMAMGDWDEADGHKMHFPQLPDPTGWDVAMYNDAPMGQIELADDWVCSEDGPVNDIHFWVSWKYGEVGEINKIKVRIYSNDPGDVNRHSQPDQELWNQSFNPEQFTVRDIANPEWQGWYNPCSGQWSHPDHQNYQQINITDIMEYYDPFWQAEGEVYWLSLKIETPIGGPRVGWKTADVHSYPFPYTGQHFLDDAVYDCPGMGATWSELRDPRTYESLDLAFVITPEPGTLAVLAFGACLPLLRRRRSR